MAALIEKADAADFDASEFTLQTPKGAVIDTSWERNYTRELD